MKDLGAENVDVPQRRMAFRVLGNPSLGSNSNISINDQAAAIKEIHDVETLFGVKFTSQSDIDVFYMSIKEGKYADILSTMSTADIDVVLINDIESGKHDGLLSGLTNADRMETLDALDDSINLNVDESTIPSDHIVQSVDINTKSTSYAGATGASAKDQPNVNSYFRTLVADPVFDGVNVSIPRKVVKKEQLGETWAEKDYDEFQRLFFFKFDFRAGLEVKLHDVPIQVFKEDGISLIATFIGKPVILDSYTSSICNESWGRSSFAWCLIEVNSEADLMDVVTIGIPSLSGDGFTKETIRVEYEWRQPRCDICKIFCHVHDYCPKKVTSPLIVTTSNVTTPTVEKTNDGFQTVGKKKKRKGKSKPSNGGQITGPLVKHNVRYEPKATTTAPKKGATYVGNTSQSSSMLKTTDDEEDVENVHDESANLIHNTNAGGSSSFTAAVG
ncbi:hypothetical protein Tco_0784988 [Tanacetum coccineum]